MKRTPTQQKYIDSQKRSRKAKALAEQNNASIGDFRGLKSRDNTYNYDKKEINSFLSLE